MFKLYFMSIHQIGLYYMPFRVQGRHPYLGHVGFDTNTQKYLEACLVELWQIMINYEFFLTLN